MSVDGLRPEKSGCVIALRALQEVQPPDVRKGECLLFKPIHRGWGTAVYTRDVPLDELKVKIHPERVVVAVPMRCMISDDTVNGFGYQIEIF